MENEDNKLNEGKAGRPFKFQDPEEMARMVDDYFKTVPEDEWTWTGLAIHLDFTHKRILKEYRERDGFSPILMRAMLRIENGYEKDLKKKGHAGSIFALKNFNWKDKQEVEQSGQLKIVKISSEFAEGELVEED